MEESFNRDDIKITVHVEGSGNYNMNGVEYSRDIEEQFEVAERHSGGLADILHSPFGGELARPFARDIFLRHVPIVGGHHVKDIEKLWEKLNVCDIVHLRREPDNPVDDYAILVLN